MDNAKNFAKVTVSTGYDASATSIVLTTGHGAKLPTAPFNAVWWNSTDYADPADDPNVEIVRVTAISTDTLTVTRAQESTSASTKNTGGKTYKMIAGLTAKTINTDIPALDQPSDQLLIATVSLSSSNILNLHTTPITLVAAPGAGKLILVDQVLFSFTGGTAYANGDNLRVQYNGDTTSLVGSLNSTVLNTTSSSTNLRILSSNIATTAGTNKAVEVGLTSATAFITGTGTLKVFIRYRIITL